MIQLLYSLARTLLRLLRDCILVFFVFALALCVGIFFILRAALPFLLRAAAIAAFVFGWLQGILATNTLYTVLTDNVGALFVAAALGVALIAVPVRALRGQNNIWSAFALAGALGFASALFCAQADASPLLQWLARGLPVSLAASGLLYLAVTNKSRRVASQRAPISTPPEA